MGVEDGGDDLGVAADPPDRVGGQRVGVGGLGDAVIMQPGAQGVEVDQHDHLRHPAGLGACRYLCGVGAGDQLDEGVGLQLVERQVRVLLVGLGCGDGGVEGGGHSGVGLGVELEMGVAHPGGAVDPAAHLAVPTVAGLLRQAVVAGQDPFQAAHVPAERFD